MFVALAAVLAVLTASAAAAEKQRDSPEAAGRTYGQTYKDMVLAACIARAYQQDTSAALDAGSSFSALQDWTVYDLEHSAEAITGLVDKYLARDYSNPLAESEIKGIRFDLLKCLDLYHSRELTVQMRRFVWTPNRSYRQDYPPKR